MSYGYRGRRAKRSAKRTALLMMAAAVLALLAVGSYFLHPGAQGAPVDVQSGSASSGEPAGSAAGSGQSDISQPPPEEPVVPEVPPYDLGQPAPEREAVDNSYFDDAAFVGDSRTDGFLLYSGIGTGTNLTSNGLSIFTLSTKKALTIDGESCTLLEALALEEYGKVYLCLGVNELGIYRDDEFYESYCAAIDQIRAAQSNAVIYIQGLIPLNEGQIQETNGNKFNLTNDHLRVYNDLMRRVAEEKQVVYLDLYSAFVDENGELPQGASRDGVHLVKESCKQWLEYLKTHTVEFDVLYPDGPPVVEDTVPDTAPEDRSVQG